MPVQMRAPLQRRSVTTRLRLVEAASECLVEVGLAGASTALIASRAGMSQGAVFKHFPTKADLLGATVTHILAGFVDDFRLGISEALLGKKADAVHAACVVLWRIFRSAQMRAVFEIYVAARTDAELTRRLAPILERHRASILGEARRLFPKAAGGRDFEGAVDAIVYAMQGAALGMFAPGVADPDAETEHLAFLERLARRELGGA